MTIKSLSSMGYTARKVADDEAKRILDSFVGIAVHISVKGLGCEYCPFRYKYDMGPFEDECKLASIVHEPVRPQLTKRPTNCPLTKGRVVVELEKA
jgi:hypothetical protein